MIVLGVFLFVSESFLLLLSQLLLLLLSELLVQSLSETLLLLLSESLLLFFYESISHVQSEKYLFLPWPAELHCHTLQPLPFWIGAEL